jgi:hypothetical protein
MNNLNLTPTTEKIISENYPYGFNLRTTKTDYLEFNPKFGFRHCSQTVNPKTERLNKPKKSTYYPIMVLGTDENGHCKSFVLDFYGDEGKDKVIEFLSNQDNFNLFTPEQIEYIYLIFLMHIKVDIKAKVIYCGSDFEQLKPLYEKQIKIITNALKNPTTNNFPLIKFDWVAIDNTKQENYQPFKVTEYSIL